MPITIEALGGVRVLRDGKEVSGLPSKPRRCATLLYLAIERETTRDAVMGVFWPERDPDKARHSLSQTLYELRQDLGESWLEVRGERLLVTAEVECDVHAFEKAVEDGRYGAGLELCRGAFLPMPIVDTTEFEAWADKHRARLERQRKRAHRGLVESLSSSGKMRQALRAAHAWAEVDPLDDESQHALIELLARVGRRADALKQYGEYERLIRAELDVDPLDQTKELAERIRRGELGQTQVARHPHAPGGVAVPFPPSDPLEGWPRARRLVYRGLNVLGLAAAGAMAIMALWPPAGPAPLDPNKVVVFPLADDSGGTEIGLDVAQYVKGLLDHAVPLNPIDGWSRLTPAQRTNIAALSPEDELAISRDRGARYFVAGRASERGDSVQISLRVHDAEGDSVVAQATRDGPLESMVRVTEAVLIAVFPGWIDPGRPVDLSPLVERDPGAVASLMAGDREYRLGRFTEALALYDEAVDADSAFAYAALKGAQAASWTEQMTEARAMATLAVANADILPVKHRLLARGLEHYLVGRADSAAATFRSAIRIDPEWGEAWMALGETYKHLLPIDGAGDSIPRLAFEQARQHDPGFNPPLIHLAEFAMQRGEIEVARQMLDSLRVSRSNSDATAHLALMYDCLSGAVGPREWAQAAVADSTSWETVVIAAKRLAEGGSQLGCAEAGFRSVWESESLAIPARAGGGLGLQILLVALGRHDEAAATLAALEAGAPSFGRYYVVEEVAGAPFRVPSQAYEASVRARLGADLSAVSPVTLWLLGGWHASHGDSLQLREFLAAAATTRGTSGTEESALALGSLQAFDASVAGRTGEALERLATLVPIATRDVLVWDPVRPMAMERLLKARLLHQSGRQAEAIRAAAVLDQHGPFVYLAFIPESLRLRRDAAMAMDSIALAERFSTRLRIFGAQGSQRSGS